MTGRRDHRQPTAGARTSVAEWPECPSGFSPALHPPPARPRKSRESLVAAWGSRLTGSPRGGDLLTWRRVVQAVLPSQNAACRLQCERRGHRPRSRELAAGTRRHLLQALARPRCRPHQPEPVVVIVTESESSLPRGLATEGKMARCEEARDALRTMEHCLGAGPAAKYPAIRRTPGRPDTRRSPRSRRRPLPFSHDLRVLGNGNGNGLGLGLGTVGQYDSRFTRRAAG
jgi:hypothetical protein